MTVAEHYDRLGIPDLSETDYHGLLRALPAAEAREYLRVHQDYCNRGDLASSLAFSGFVFTYKLPGLEIYWADAFHRVYNLGLDQVELPELIKFIKAAPPLEILDAGCGDALALTYLASELPRCKFVGVDVSPEAIVVAKNRIETLALGNVTVAEHDIFDLIQSQQGSYDGVIMRNLLDDDRLIGTEYLEAEFNTIRKLTAIKQLLKPSGWVWLSLTPYPYFTDYFQHRLESDISQANMKFNQQVPLQYRQVGQTRTHYLWMLYPELATTQAGINSRPEYEPSYHYARGTQIPFEDVVLTEQCYINLSSENDCPRCGQSDQTGIIHTGGPARTKRNFWKVMGRVYSCNRCAAGYVVIEVID